MQYFAFEIDLKLLLEITIPHVHVVRVCGSGWLSRLGMSNWCVE